MSDPQPPRVIDPDCDEAPDVDCPCGAKLHLWFNGGELDEQTCRCGRVYSTRIARMELLCEEPSVLPGGNVEDLEREVRRLMVEKLDRTPMHGLQPSRHGTVWNVTGPDESHIERGRE